jgi:hypothetical protein
LSNGATKTILTFLISPAVQIDPTPFPLFPSSFRRIWEYTWQVTSNAPPTVFAGGENAQSVVGRGTWGL